MKKKKIKYFYRKKSTSDREGLFGGPASEHRLLDPNSHAHKQTLEPVCTTKGKFTHSIKCKN